jgi:O-antigen/teichoic acid export membrane protein
VTGAETAPPGDGQLGDEPAPTRASSLVANYFVLVSTFLGGQLLGLIGLAIVSRRVGPSGLGDYGYASSVAAFFGLPLIPGFALLGVRRLATTSPPNRPRIVFELQALAVANAVIALTLLTVAAAVLTPTARAAALLPIVGLTLVVNAVAVEWALQGLQQVRRLGLFRLIGQVAYLAALLAFLLSGGFSVFDYAWANVVGLSVTASLDVIYVWRAVGRPFGLVGTRVFSEPLAAWKIIRVTLPLAASAVMLQIYYYSDVVLLGQLDKPSAVGLYTTAGRLPLAMLALATLWVTVFYPHAAHLWERNRMLLLKQVGHFGTLAVLVAAPTIPIAFSIGPDALGSLFGEAFRAGGITFALLVAFAAVALVNANVGNVMLAAGDDRGFMATVSAAAIVNVGLNFVFIPQWGPAGAAAASVAAEVVALSLAAIRVSRVVGPIEPPPLRRLLGGVLSLALAGACLIVLAATPWPVRGLVSGAVYFSVALTVGAIRPRDLRTPV